jgi:hypothetical protein
VSRRVLGRSELLHASKAGFDVERAAPIAMRRMIDLGEADYQHCGFLLWAIQPPRQRNRSAVARLCDRGEATIRQWWTHYRWGERANFPEAQEWAIQLFKALYPSMVIPALNELPTLRELRDSLERMYEPTDEERAEKAAVVSANDAATLPAAPPVADTTEAPSASGQSFVPPQPKTQDDRDRMRQLLRGAMAGLAKEMQAGNTKARVQDLPALVRAYLLVNGSPTDIVATLNANQNSGAVSVESVRVRLARQGIGGEAAVLDAMLDDLNELRTVIEVMRTSDEAKQTEQQDVEQNEVVNGK